MKVETLDRDGNPCEGRLFVTERDALACVGALMGCPTAEVRRRMYDTLTDMGLIVSEPEGTVILPFTDAEWESAYMIALN